MFYFLSFKFRLEHSVRETSFMLITVHIYLYIPSVSLSDNSFISGLSNSGIADATTRHIASLVARQKKTSSKRKTRVTTFHPEPTPVVPHFIRTQIKELVSSYPSGLLGSMFALAFNRRFGQELNYDKLRFKSLGHLLDSISDIVKIEDMRGGGYRVYGRGNDKVNLGM